MKQSSTSQPHSTRHAPNASCVTLTLARAPDSADRAKLRAQPGRVLPFLNPCPILPRPQSVRLIAAHWRVTVISRCSPTGAAAAPPYIWAPHMASACVVHDSRPRVIVRAMMCGLPCNLHVIRINWLRSSHKEAALFQVAIHKRSKVQATRRRQMPLVVPANGRSAWHMRTTRVGAWVAQPIVR